jgi:hypothetical protein
MAGRRNSTDECIKKPETANRDVIKKPTLQMLTKRIGLFIVPHRYIVASTGHTNIRILS